MSDTLLPDPDQLSIDDYDDDDHDDNDDDESDDVVVDIPDA
jgi:hypothetical protein